ncbi:hypothetical protein MMC07_002330 [Pseudocyphellaria aurata]|nr:hypothetical protein [Pseudocyphellaria aurata]
MVLELHIYGPAFSLPSIDAQCLAAVAYVNQAVRRDEWILVASCDSTASPTKELPVLLDDTRWIGGFQNIVDHLRKRSIRGSLDSDNHSSQEKADITAFSSFVESNGQPLLDLSLYVSTENYHSITRSAYSRLLPWPYPWFLPSQRRAAAKNRTEHLNVSSLDLDSNSNKQRTLTTGSDIIPESLRNSRQTLSSLVFQPQHASRFRLEALAEAFFEPLAQLLDGKRYMIPNDSPSSLDCLAFAYLALSLIPDVPQPWLADSMKTRFPALCVYVNDLAREFCIGPVNVEDAFPDMQLEVSTGCDSDHMNPKTNSKLPWRTSQQHVLRSAMATLMERTFGSIPILGNVHNTTISKEETRPVGAIDNESTPLKAGESRGRLDIEPVFLAVGTIFVTLGSYLAYSKLLNFSGSWIAPNKRTLSDMGEAGAMLSSVNFGSYDSKAVDQAPGEDTIPITEIDINV